MLMSGERHVTPNMKDIRADHVARYKWAVGFFKGARILDLGCGIGYGSKMLASAGCDVTACDNNEAAIEYARRHYGHGRIDYQVCDLSEETPVGEFDAAVCFEVVEHLKNPKRLLRSLAERLPALVVSVPDEDGFPYRQEDGRVIAFHHRHYTRSELLELLQESGWHVNQVFTQADKESDLEPAGEVPGRTLVAACVNKKQLEGYHKDHGGPRHVAIVGLGPSMDQYTSICKRLGGRSQYCDETWGINSLGNVIECDRIFHMDDVRIQEIRAEAQPESNIAAMLRWLKTTEIPVVTSRPHPDYPALEPFPLIEVLNQFQFGYFNSTAAYAVAYALWIGVEKISIFGCDYTYPNAHDAEKGRACVEFWLGMAAERDVRLVVPKTSTLLDAIHTQRERFYGYDTLDLTITQNDAGKIGVEFTERTDLPSAAEIEKSYDHSVHPNPLVTDNPGTGEQQTTDGDRPTAA